MPKDDIGAKIDKLIEAISKTPPAPTISNVLPAAPSHSNSNSGDHDLLQRIDTKLERVIVDVQKLNDNFAHRIDVLENEKVDKISNDKIVTDHESRVRLVEKFQENLLGKMSVMIVIVSFVIVLLTGWVKAKLGM